MNTLEAEYRLLGGSMISIDWLNTLMDQLQVTHFNIPLSRTVFITIKELYSRNEEVNFDKVASLCIAKDVLLKDLLDIFQLANTSFNINGFISDLKDDLLRKKLLEIGTSLVSSSQSDQGTTAILRATEEKLFSINRETATKTMFSVKEMLTEPVSYMKTVSEGREKFLKGETSFDGFPTHFLDLDKHISGLVPGHLTLIGGRSGVGKSTFALNLINSLIMHTRLNVLFFSLEMTANELVSKLICLSSEVPYEKFRKKDLSDQQMSKLTTAVSVWENKTLLIEEQPSLGIDQLKSRSIRAKKTHNIDVIFIDYVQLLTTPRKYENRHLEVADISRKLKEIAKELHLPIVALAQLNREVEKREGKKPQVSDLRESGQLEQDADEILLLHCPENKPGLSEVIVAKNRFGSTGVFNLLFDKSLGTLKNYDKNSGNSDQDATFKQDPRRDVFEDRQWNR